MKWNEDEKILCCNCGNKPAVFKKAILCRTCYGKAYRQCIIESKPTKNLQTKDIVLCGPTTAKYQHKAEILFAQGHPGFIYQPTTFHLGDFKYSPDFYDPFRNTYYEIIGTRQRFEQLRVKLKKFRESYPLIKLEVCCPDGRPYHSTKNSDVVTTTQENIVFQAIS